ncbi:hypothetical protein IKP85_02020 [bacterium]|nr:hypothetical protein [bacterium]
MAITPVTGFKPVSTWNNSIPFGKRYDDDSDNEYAGSSRTSSNLKRVPVIVMIAMSPLTTANTSASSPITFEPVNATEIVQQSDRQTTIHRDKNETMKVIRYNEDNNAKNYESIGFNYWVDEPNRRGVMSGVIMAICEDQRSDGKYLLAYKEVSKNNSMSNYKLCYIPKIFGVNIKAMLKLPSNNSSAAAIPLKEFTDYFGRNSVNNAPTISSAVSRYESK